MIHNSIYVRLIASLCASIFLQFFVPTAHAGVGSLDATGMVISVNYRFPPTDADLATLRAELQGASAVLFDATDGQVWFREVTISVGRAGEDEAHIWILPDPGRSGVSFFGDGSGLSRPGAHVTLFRNGIERNVIAHELGHLIFGLGDEYSEQRRWGSWCGIGPAFDDGTWTDQNNTLMQFHWFMSELTVPANHDLVRGDSLMCPGPTATTTAASAGRLHSGAVVRVYDGTSYATADATAGATFGDIDIVDSAWATHKVRVYFEHVGTNTWVAHYVSDAREFGTPPATGSSPVLGEIARIELSFTASGEIAMTTPASPALTLTNLASGGADLQVPLDLSKLREQPGTANLWHTGTSNGRGLCEDSNCARIWNTTTSQFESSQHTIMHGGRSEWEVLASNYPFITMPAGLPVALPPSGAPPRLSLSRTSSAASN